MKIFLYSISRKSIILLLVLCFFSFSKAADITVSNTNDSGAGSLRQAIIDANLTTASDNIIFNMTGTTVRTITLLSELPQIIYPVNINGYSKVNSSAGPIGSRNILMEIDCGNVENTNGIFDFATTAGGSSVSGLAIYNKGIGASVINVNNINGLHIWGNYFGTRANGTASSSTLMRSGAIIYIGSSSAATNVSNLLIGTNGDNINDANEGNVVANSQTSVAALGNGIMFDGDGGGLTLSNSRIAGNFIGLEADGTTLAPIGQGTTSSRGIGIIFYRTTATNVFIGTNADGVSDPLERNIISGCNSYGLEIEGGSGFSIAGNYIGTDKTGTLSKPNALSNPAYLGVYLQHRGGVYPVENISIGFDDRIHDASDAVNVRNIISGNSGRGIGVGSSAGATGPRTSNIIIAGNYIGVDVTGNTALPNGLAATGATAVTSGAGVVLSGAINTRIGTNSNGIFDDLERNVISGNVNGAGLYLSSSSFDTENNIVAGNYIGVGANGTTAIGNGQAGIYFIAGINRIFNNRIGSNDDGVRDAIEANVIANNGKFVSATVRGGVNVTGNATQNRISRNIFYDNGGLPIDLGNNGVTPNDGATTAGSPNILLDYPVITRYTINSATQLSVSGYVSICSGNESTAGATIAGAKTIQFYKVADDGDQNGAVTGGACTRVTSHGEGVQYLGSITGVVNTFTNQTVNLVSGATFSAGDKLVAIAIDANWNTSEFGAMACAAGTASPAVNSSLSNTCSAITVNLNTAHTGTAPGGSVLQWFTNNTHTGTALSGTQITQAGSGTYYAFYYDNIENCYSPASVAVVVTINSCTTNCNTTAAIPTNGTYSVNGVTVTSSSTGSIMTYPPTFTTCGGHTFSSGSYLVGSGAGENPPNSASAWSITFTFDKPVNNLVILLGATGHTDNENFIFNSNGGTVSLSSLSSCFSTISGNQIISGAGSLAAQGGGGLFKITAPSNFTSLTINGAGGYNGSLMAFCRDSILPAPTVSIAPTSQSVCVNTTPLAINASATGTGTLSYNWYRNTSNSSSGWSLIAGATSASYMPPTAVEGTMYYYAVVTDTNGTAASNVSRVEVTACINPCVPTSTNPDSDGDGVADACDLDDDNDGILDKDECVGYIANNVNGPWKGRTASNITVSASPSTTQTNSQYIQIDPQVSFSVNQNGGDQRFGSAATSSAYVLTFSTPVPANEIGLMIDDVNIATGQSPNASFKIDVDFGSGFVNPNGVLMMTLAGRNSGVGYNPATGVPTFQYSPNTGGEDIYLKGIGTTLIKAVRITGNNLGSGDAIAYSFFAIGKCDADGDGIPNELDLDSDGDGCPDAYEGAANIPQSRLVTAGGTVAGGSTSVNQNLCGSGTCVDANGVPQLLPLPAGYSNTAGQAIGQSQSFSKNDCLDSDADGIPDWEDVDDDNDGILDTAENECLNAVIAGYPTSIPVILSTDFGRPSTGTAQNNLNLTADLSHKFGYPANSGAVIVRIYNAHVHPTADEFYVRGDLPVTRWEITGSVASVIGIEHGSDYYPGQLRSINLMDNAPLPVAHTTNVAGTWNRTASGNIYTLQNLTGTRLIDQGLLHYANLDYNNSKRFEVSTNESGPSRWSTYFIRIYPECDTDKDGIPNRLDLDSDADGCSDALEGAANILYGQLMTAGGTLSGGSTTVDKNICTTCVSTDGTNIGLPQFATPPSGYSNATGQAAGESYNSLANNCYCTKPGTPGTPDGYTKVGITIQEKQTAWPENIPNGHIALESKTQGLVITRVAHVSFVPQPTDSIANPFAGMLVYDMLDECVKLFNGVNWKCIARSCNDVF